MKKALILMLTLLAAAQSVANDNKPPTLHRFEWHQPIIASDKQATFRFEVPASVYGGASRKDLGDVRIFNASGEIVPHALWQYAPTEKAPQTEKLQHFPYYKSQSRKSRDENLSVSVIKRPDGTLVAVQTAPGKETQVQEQKLAGYVLDASAIKQPIVALEAQWEPQKNGAVFHVVVETSDDLQSWRTVAGAAQLVDMNHGGHRLLRNRIELTGLVKKYLRVSKANGTGTFDFNITSFTVETAAQAGTQQPQKWVEAIQVRAGDKPGEFLFDSQDIPALSIRLGFPHENTLAPVKVFHRADDKAAWQQAASFVAYRLKHEYQNIVSPDVKLDGSQDRQWRIVFDQASGGIGQGVPKVTLGWMPQQGIFIARGAGPFVLAYGSREAPQNGYSAATLVPGFKPEMFMQLPVATLEQPVHANPGMGSPAPKDTNWRIISLWAILIVGVLALGFMAWKLLGQMNIGDAQKQ